MSDETETKPEEVTEKVAEKKAEKPAKAKKQKSDAGLVKGAYYGRPIKPKK